ncbi:hypothetical protein A2210_02280 [Candidatus Woesebacteria bacterium RIFOXYA1_FULL_40_18]|uniref:UPF0102 protein A2210_02280 n=2 Tax=Candidatus Woeseibacteriota TaxID=1752722 RepID=A0A1F8CJQ4_9BACT|nr:MAG: hypothetical protein A2210_02280 [Candidatus Woesebacteria bacterium RIFOXYA1_FULL_40_18]OGM86952.1 MAG: hypothetical protein A2614_00075 [Candidatus Woesebacteria bacterium RIFOXYD1_FULL_40_21]
MPEQRLNQKSKRLFGNLGENYACRLLQKSGYRIIERNFTSRFGEIDIIALDKDTLVFVEVKTRWSRRFGLPQEAVTPQKLFRIKRTAEYFSLRHPRLPKKLRIDVVAIEIENNIVTSARIINCV